VDGGAKTAGCDSTPVRSFKLDRPYADKYFTRQYFIAV
jgi:hypothetical protein